MTQLSKKEARDQLWRSGNLIYKLDKGQKELYRLFYGNQHRMMTWLLARRSGKTFCLCVLAIEQCLRKKNSIVKIVSPTKLQIVNILRPIMRTILEDCPEDVRPEFKAKDWIYYFPNGSEIQLAGADAGHAEKLRGGDSDLWMIDEAGSVDNLKYIIESILVATTLITKGKGVLASTPPAESEHDFLYFIERSQSRGSLIKKTIYDNPRITTEDIEEMANELGGKHTDAWRREALCELIKDASTAVLPEFSEELEKVIVRDWPLPPFYDAYTSMDLGGKDLTVVLFGYYDFRADKVVVQDELVLDFQQKDVNIETLTQKIEEKERKLWHNVMTNETKTPYLRVSDINYIVTQEIYKQSHGKINFLVPKKDDNDAAIQNMRIMLQNKKIMIDPRCETLVRHLKNVKWRDKSKVKFGRSPDNGHYDAVDALKYLIRSIQYTKNPYPSHYDYNLQNLHVSNPKEFYKNDQVEVFRKIFNMKSRK